MAFAQGMNASSGDESVIEGRTKFNQGMNAHRRMNRQGGDYSPWEEESGSGFGYMKIWERAVVGVWRRD